MKEAHRQFGAIEGVREDDCDGRFDTTIVFIKFDGSVQGFGTYVLNELRPAWNAELCAMFKVKHLEELVGKRCWALRCFSGWSEPIEGLETVDGQRFTATDFFRRHLDRPVTSVLEKKRESLQSTIAAATRRINDATRELAALESDYVEWGSPAGGDGNG